MSLTNTFVSPSYAHFWNHIELGLKFSNHRFLGTIYLDLNLITCYNKRYVDCSHGLPTFGAVGLTKRVCST